MSSESLSVWKHLAIDRHQSLQVFTASFTERPKHIGVVLLPVFKIAKNPYWEVLAMITVAPLIGTSGPEGPLRPGLLV